MILSGVMVSGSARAEIPAARSVTPMKTALVAKHRAKKHPHAAIFSGRLAKSDELRDAPPAKPSGEIRLFAVNFQESMDVNIYNEDGTFNDDAVDRLNHLFRCKRTGTEKAIDPRLFEQLSRIYDHYQRRIELVSGFRNQPRTTSYHFNGSASDVRIPGVSDRELHQFVASLDAGGMGLGLYPHAGFIHVDVRPDASYRWVDYSGPGTSDMGHPHKKAKKKARLVG